MLAIGTTEALGNGIVSGNYDTSSRGKYIDRIRLEIRITSFEPLLDLRIREIE